jgi:hypothetical protein
MENVVTLKKYTLDYTPSWEYVLDNLKNVNTLSDQLISILDFKNGHFFTLLPDDANFNLIYNFKEGMILPQFPKQEMISDGQKATYSLIPNIRNELVELLLKEIKLDKKSYYIIDKVTGTAGNNYNIHYQECHPLFHKDEVYFLLGTNNISINVLSKCLSASISFWHSLCVLTKSEMKNVKQDFTIEKIREVCQNVELVIIGAYDGEGYIFWEKNPTKENKGFFLN